ncbi:MAG: potassium channel family protein [bacterium]
METKQFIVIGLGRFGTSVAENLAELGHEVLALDIDEDQVEKVKDSATQAVTIDNLNEETLESLGAADLDVGIMAIGEDIQANIMGALMLKELDLMVVARAQNELHGKLLGKIGADRIIYPEHDMGARVAYNLTAVNVLDYIELSPEISVAEVTVSPAMASQTLKDLNLRSQYGVNVLAIKKSGDEINISPRADDSPEEEDTLVLVGPNTGINEMKEKFK